MLFSPVFRVVQLLSLVLSAGTFCSVMDGQIASADAFSSGKTVIVSILGNCQF